MMHQTHLTITTYSHYFSCTELSPVGEGLCKGFARQFVSYKMENIPGTGRQQRVPDKVYAAADKGRQYFHFHINLLDKFNEYLVENHKTENLIKRQAAPKPKAVDIELKMHEKYTAKDDQVDHIEYLINSEHPSTLLTRQTGTGKTFCAMAAASRIGKRVGIVVKAMYVKKWHADVKELCQITDKDILVVGGGGGLKALQVMAKEGLLNAKVIIFSLDGIQNWYKEFEDDGLNTLEMGYECKPWDLFEFCGIGTVIRDEVHQRFHQLFKMDMYLNVQRSISLSATLITHDPFISRMYEVMFPVKWRGKDLGLSKYIDAYAVHYYFKNPDKIRTKEYGNKNYAHTAVEKSILKHVPTMLEYFRFIHEVMKSSYFQHPRKTKKLAVYASSVEMCTRLTEYFKSKYPELDIRRYCAGENDPYENVIDADIRFSTVGSSGTAIDIPNLTTVILTIALSSIQANIQVLGRLRELKGGATPAENQPAFYYLTADNIEKHVFYHNAKKEMLELRARTFNDIYSGFNV